MEGDLYIFTAKHHPKRGKRYLHHFTIRRAFRDIRDVVWHTDGKKGYVREGEYVRIDRWNALHAPRLAQEAAERQRVWVEGERALQRVLGEMKWAKVVRQERDRREAEQQAEADAFRLEGEI